MLRMPALALATALVAAACSTPSGVPLGASQGPVDHESGRPSASSARAIEGYSCTLPGPPLLTPANGAVVSGTVEISAPLLEGPCYITATVVFTVRSAATQAVVFQGCDDELTAHRSWDTRATKNGSYQISAQRACGCNACGEPSTISVSVANP